MAVPTIYFVLGLLMLLQLGENSLAKTFAGTIETSSNGCFSECIQKKMPSKNCAKLCHSVKKRSLDSETCDFENASIYADDPSEALGLAPVHVEFKLDKSKQAYKWVNISWIVPKVTKVNSGDNSTKIADVKGFFVQWQIGGDSYVETLCRAYPKDARNVILNASILHKEKISRNVSIYLIVYILPLSGKGSSVLKPFKYQRNSNRSYYTYWETVPITFETVISAKQTATSVTQSTTFSERPTSTITPKESKNLPPQTGICESKLCKYVVVGSVAAVVAVIVVAIIYMVRSGRLCSSGGMVIPRVTIATSKDFCYVSYFCEDGKVGDLSKSVINFLMTSDLGDLRTVAVNVLAHSDLDNYYNLGARKFSELYMQEAHYVIVLVTKKYLDLCNKNINIELEKERRRVFEEINYIDRAQFEFPQFEKSKKVTNSKFTNISIEGLASFENKKLPRKRFIAFMLEPLSDKLPTWMKDWPVYSWPKDKSAFLNYIGHQD